MSKKILFIIVIVILIIAGISFAKKISNDNETVKTTTNVAKNNVNKTTNTEIENKQEENEQEENVVEQEDQEDIDDDSNTLEEKAKSIVKENWGEDDSVYFSYDGIDNEGRYIICVRDKNTTKALYFYYVDVETGTYDIE